jgi:amino acid adenylation domain-containing protein
MSSLPERKAPLSYEQERFFLFEGLGSGSTASWVAFVYWITGELDLGALSQAIAELHRRHEVLRTGYPDVATQAVLPPDTPLAHVDLSAYATPDAEVTRLVEESVEELSVTGLTAAAPIRWTCYTLGGARHALTLVAHHILIDAWSKTIMEQEISALYQAARAGRPSMLVDVQLQYADYAISQRAEDPADPGAAVGYWVEHLHDLPGATRLPFDRSPSPDTGPAGTRANAPISDSVVAGATLLARQEHASLFMVLFAGFAWQLSHYGGQRDFVVGIPTGGRGEPELESVVGCFVDTVPCRLRLPDAPTFRELIAGVREATLDACDHGVASLERVVAALRPEREPGREPLIQVSFGSMSTPAGNRSGDVPGLRLSGLDVVEEERCPTATELELAVILVSDRGRLTGMWEYKTDLFDAATVTLMQDDFERLVDWALAHPDTPLNEFTVLADLRCGDAPTADERALMLGVWNDTDRPVQTGSLPYLFAEQVRRSPEAIAVSCGDVALTYAELDARSDRLARRLARLGVRIEDRVGLLMDRSIDLVVAELAVVKVGGAYVPLDVRAPVDRMRRVLTEAGCRVLLTDRSATDTAEQLGADRLLVVDAPAAESEFLVTIDPDNLAYVMYTSGSTGVPKGVAIRHRDVVARALDSRVGAEYERVLLHSPLAFDASTYELWVPLLNGGQVVVAPAGELDVETLRETITGHRVTGLWLTGGLFGLVAQHAPECLAGVREVWTGSDVIPAATVKRVLRFCPQTTVVYAYGPTETTIHATSYRMRDGEPVPDVLLIGRALDNTRAHVLDSDLRLVRPGVVGEVYLAGAGLARGYLNRAALTAERFLPDPFGAPGSRMYRSGDLAQWTDEGQLRFAGRSDDQVKIRGFRVELGEIQRVLASCAGVAQAAVVARAPDSAGSPAAKSIVAYLVAEEQQSTPTAARLRTLLGAALPEYMIPSAFVTLERMPLTRNGKVDLRALPEPELDRRHTDGVAPRTEPERVVARIWTELLGLASVGVEDDFFELGGHSLTAAQIVARIGELVPGLPTRGLMRDVLKYPTVAAFATVLADRMFEHAIGGSNPAARIPVTRRGDTVALSLGQKRLWFLDQFVNSSAEYLVPLILRISGELDVEALAAALTEIVDRHEILRTSIVVEGDEPVGRVRRPGSFALVRAQWDPDERSDGDELSATVTTEATRPFDLEHGLPVRATLWRVNGAEHLLCLTFHHIVFDGWSVGLLFDELETLYRAFTAGLPSPLPAIAVRYADVTAYQEASQNGPEFAAKLDFWRTELDGAEPFEISPDLPRPTRRTAPGVTRPFTIGADVVRRLERIGLQHGATLFMTLLAGWQTLAQRYSGCDDILVGTTAAERELTESEPLIGLFINMLALRGDLAGNPSFAELVERTRDRMLEVYAHQDVPFDRLVGELSPERDLGRTPIFQVMFKLDSARQRAAALAGLALRHLPHPPIPAKYDVEVALMRVAEGLAGELTYDTGLYLPETIDRLIGHFQTLLAEVAENPAKPIDQFTLMTPAERDTVRDLAARPRVEFPRRCLHDLITDQVARTPDAIAVVQDEVEISYAELDTWSDRIATALGSYQVGPEVVVGVMLDRTPAMVAALLGVLKTGSAYLPIEPGTPPARVAQLIGDSHAPVCLVPEPLADVVSAAGCEPLVVPAANALSGAREAAHAHRAAVPDNLVSIYYTSGSTGKPKGVASTHAGWVNRMCWMQRHHPLAPGETVLHKTTLTFDDAAVEIFWPLLTGGRVALLGAGHHRDPRAIADAVIRYRAVHVQFVPSVLELFLDTISAGDVGRMTELRSVLSSGEVLRPALVHRFRELFADRVTLDNTWGATEVSIDSTCRVCVAQDGAGAGAAVSVGVPIDNNEVLVLDRRFDRLPVGVPGELCIGGVGLARGYLGDPRRTAEVFVPHPELPGERVYRTGDWGRMRADGSLSFLHRRDDQVKVRGVRIELGEVEHALRAHRAVTDAAVIAHTAPSGEKRLAAYVVAGCTPGDLVDFVRELLPAYAVPSSITILDALPRQSNGKLNRRLLPEPEQARSDDDYVAPTTPTEEVLAEIWASVLDRERIGINDDFFALGGHSLLATRAIGRMRQAFVADLPLTLMFERPTVARAAAAVEAIVLAEITSLTEAETRQLLG